MAKKVDSKAVIEAIENGGRGVDVGEIADELLTAFGGSKAFAHNYYREFAGSKVGSISRAKMLDGVLRVVGAAKQKTNPLADINQMTEEELKAYLLTLLNQLTEAPDAAPQAEQAGP